MPTTVTCYTVSRERTRRCSTVHLDPKNFSVNILGRTPKKDYVAESPRSLFIHPESVCGAPLYLLATRLIRHLSTCQVIAHTYVFFVLYVCSVCVMLCNC